MRGEGILRLLARMGLSKDDQPPTHQWDPPPPERKWRTSLIGSYAANVAVVLHKCSAAPGSDDEFKVQLFVKEEPVYLNQCQNSLCSLDELLAALGPVADQCSRDDGCNPPNAAPTLHQSPFIYYSILFVAIFQSFVITIL